MQGDGRGGASAEFMIEVARGRVPGVVGLLVHGRNADVDIGSEDLWVQGASWVAPTQARVHNIVSSDANDTAAGTGARTVRIKGLNGSYTSVTETVTMNGVGAVATTNSYVFIESIEVLTAGSGGANAGAITATAVTDATVSNSMAIGRGKSSLAVYQVPDGYKAILVRWYAGVQANATATVRAALLVSAASVFVQDDEVELYAGGAGIHVVRYEVPRLYAARTLIKLRGTTDTNNTIIYGGFEIILLSV